MFLPKGLLYTTLLSPYFFYRQLVNKRKTYWLPFFSFLLLFDLIHLVNGVELVSFLKSNLYFIFTYFAVISFYHFFNHYEKLSLLFKQILVVNLFFVLVSVFFFFMPPDYQDWFWWVNREAMAKHEFPRLKLLTYEASYYSLLLVPIVYYYIFKFLFRQVKQNKLVTLLLILIPVLMSLSFGVIGASLLTAIILGFIFRNQLLHYRRPFLISLSVLLVFALAILVLLFFFPENPFSLRLFSIFNGTDTSANGRTKDSFYIAWLLITQKNIWFGIGLGQIKVEVEILVKAFISYWGDYNRYDIPNTMGETLAIFGISGVVLRLALQWYLFFKTKVRHNYYRLALFIFVFIYQFTGSFITNIVEYVIWILAFSQVFEQFNVKQKTT
ncbi:MAG: hypothetical protein IT236_10540 [Bacteroidia bacterium]|nr:hypothetical protein [Bacteroidia bacterium]